MEFLCSVSIWLFEISIECDVKGFSVYLLEASCEDNIFWLRSPSPLRLVSRVFNWHRCTAMSWSAFKTSNVKALMMHGSHKYIRENWSLMRFFSANIKLNLWFPWLETVINLAVNRRYDSIFRSPNASFLPHVFVNMMMHVLWELKVIAG